jgi:hypothetical protein
VRKTAADLAVIEAVNRKHLSELNESLNRFISSAEKAASDAAKTIETARAAAEKSLAAALAQIDHKIAALPEQTIRRPIPPAPEVEIEPIVRTSPQTILAEPSAIAILASPTAEKSPDSNSGVPVPAPQFFATVSTHGATETSPIEEKAVRKRPTRKPTASDNELMLGIEIPSSEFSPVAPTESAPSASDDGLTRLLVTAYIGIGNKLFVRGDGPGLNWDRGVPLQFVSIGKWRWESADATAPVTLKLYKNDEHECPVLGPVILTPGQQQQVTASFN